MMYMNYPTGVIFRSMKLIVVMIGSFVFLRRTYHVLGIVMAICYILAGLCCTLADMKVEAHYEYLGVILISLSLVFASFHSNMQESAFHHGSSQTESLVLQNVFASFLAFILVLITGEWSDAISYCNRHPQIYLYFLCRGALSYIAMQFILFLVQFFDAFTTTIVTTVRKTFTILLSFIAFPKPVTSAYVLGLGFFLTAISLNAYCGQYLSHPSTRRKIHKKSGMKLVSE